MSGHSHYSKIKHKKALTDAQKGKAFSKMAKLISVAARKGGIPEENPELREAIEKARTFNLPKANVERAIKRGTGELEGAELEEVLFEAYGPGNIAIIIEGITDNKNRAIAEVKQVLNKNNGKMAGEGSVRWLFQRKGAITLNFESEIPNAEEKEEIELKVIDAEAEDFIWQNNNLEIHTQADNLESVKKKLEEFGIKIESSSLDWVAKEEITISEREKQSAEKLFELLDENDNIQEIYSNLKD